MPAPADDLLPPGTRVGDYEIVRGLGRGGMGTVYEARHTVLEGPAALKVLSPGALLQDPGARERFLREGQAAARIRHPHVLKIFHVGRFQPTGGEPLPYLVMELLSGESLHARLAREPRPPIQVLCDLLVPVLAGVQAAHEKGVIHRDLKPDNIFLDSAEGPKVVDFGISKIVSAPSGTRAGLVIGTPEYLAPELINGAIHASAQSDQYALGVLLYEGACGQPPLRWNADSGERFEAFALRIYVGEIVPPEQLRPDLPRALADAICRALQKRPEDRFPELRDLGRVLLLFAGEGTRLRYAAELGAAAAPVIAPAPAPSTLLAPERPRRPRLWIYAGGGGAAALLLLLGVTRLTKAADPPAAPPAAPSLPALPPGPPVPPVHGDMAALGRFAIGKHEVSMKEYRAFAREKHPPGPVQWDKVPGLPETDDLPANQVSRAQAEAYCASAVPGGRLPTEAEFEQAAAQADPGAAHAGNPRGNLSPIQQGAGSAMGIHHLLGNVAEWVSGGPPGRDVARGGGVDTPRKDLSSRTRIELAAGKVSRFVGFRCAVDLQDGGGR